MDIKPQTTLDTIGLPKALKVRPQPRLVFCDPENEDDDPPGFVSKPSDDIPRNKLVSKLARGI